MRSVRRTLSLAKALVLGGRRPSDVRPSDLRLMRITGTVEYLAGFGTLTAVTLMPDRDPSDHQAYLQLAVVGLLFAALRWLAPLRLSTVYISLAVGYLYIAAIVTIARPLTATPYFFIWPTLTAGYFLGRRGLVVATGAFAVSLTTALSLNPTTTNLLQEVFPTLAVVTTVSLLVGGMREHLDRLVRELEHTAATDTLTGLANRRTFEESVERELSRVARTGSPLTLAILDLDHFKAINDSLGHAVGDEALKHFAQILRESCRLGDLPARIGGEEFGLLLPDTDADGARVFARRFLDRLRAETASDAAPLDASIGVAERTGSHESLDLLLLTADRALYEAKHRGRGQTVVARTAAPLRLESTGQRIEFVPEQSQAA